MNNTSWCALEWFKAYFSNRSQVVECHGHVSNEKVVDVGLPQGSVLRPILFPICINDVSLHFHQRGMPCQLAIDTLPYCTGNDISETKVRLLYCIDEISKWYKENNSTVNEDKCCYTVIKPKKSKDGLYFNILHS